MSHNTHMVYKKKSTKATSHKETQNLQINNTIINLFYKSVTEFVLSFFIVICYGKVKV